MQQKKLTTLLLATLICATTATAQEGFRIGVKGAAQNTWMFNKDDSDAAVPAYITTFGPAGGLSLGYNFSRSVGLAVDAYYSAEGQRLDLAQGDQTYEVFRKLSYLKLPLMLQLTSDPESGGVMFLFRIGPQFGLLMSSEYDDVQTGLTSDSDTKNLYESLVIGAVFSIGAAIPLGDATQLTTSFRADYAFGDSEDKAAVNSRGEMLWADGRATTNNVTGGIEIGFNYLFLKNSGSE